MKICKMLLVVVAMSLGGLGACAVEDDGEDLVSAPTEQTEQGLNEIDDDEGGTPTGVCCKNGVKIAASCPNGQAPHPSCDGEGAYSGQTGNCYVARQHGNECPL